MIYRNTIFRGLLFILLIVFSKNIAFSEDLPAPPAVDTSLSTSEELNKIYTDATDITKKIAELNQKIKNTKDPAEIEEFQKNVERLKTQQSEYHDLFEKIALGGINTQRFAEPSKSVLNEIENYDWQKELILIAQPVFSEMKRVTDTPRRRDALRLELKEVESRMALLNKGLESIKNIDVKTLLPETKAQLAVIQQEWQERYSELQHEQNIATLKLNDLSDKRSFTTRLTTGVWDFFKGRGLVLLITIAGVSGLIFLFSRILAIIERRNEKITSIKWRIAILLYQIVTTLIVVMAALFFLYSSGDMVLFGLAILLILAFLISSRASIPKYYNKIRIFLNMGTAREGERIMYNDLPWKISHINLYNVYLTNPLLDNGMIRLNIEILSNLISRPIKMDEVWFPTAVKDVVILPNGDQATVRRQTPEYVYLITKGSEVIYPSKNFLVDKVRNITSGYNFSIDFVISFDHAKDDPDELSKIIETSLKEAIEQSDAEMMKCVKSLSVDFKNIDSDANLVFLISVSMGSNATDYTGAMPRFIQKTCLKIAQKHGFKIPYTQIEVIQPK